MASKLLLAEAEFLQAGGHFAVKVDA